MGKIMRRDAIARRMGALTAVWFRLSNDCPSPPLESGEQKMFTLDPDLYTLMITEDRARVKPGRNATIHAAA